MDAIDCMEGNGPARGKRKELGLLIASTDAVALDAVCSEIACLGKIPAVEEAARRRLGEANLEKIKIVGERLAKIKSSFEKPITVTHRAPRWLRKLFISLNYYDFAADKKLCDLCWKCLAFCPVGAIKKKSLPIVDKALCIECFHCIEACPKKAFKTRRAKRQRVIRAIRKIAKL
jgi:ferredoxin